MNVQNYCIAVVGGGIIGLAIAMRLTVEYPRHTVVVLEKEADIAQHQTGHNSGVIHAGIYYTPGSQKANFCSSGARMLLDFCDRNDIPYEMCGKVIVASDESQLSVLEELYRRGVSNGAQDLEMISAEKLRELEPNASGIKAIFSPNTGVIDYVEVAKAYARVITKTGGDVLYSTQVNTVSRRDGKLHIETTKGKLVAHHLINCAGLHADVIAKMMGVKTEVRIIPFRGEYYSIRPDRSHLVKSLIYPVPDPKLPFLGVHFSKRIDGTIEAGPNAVLAFAREGYTRLSFNLVDTLGFLRYPGFWRMIRDHWRTGFQEQYRSVVKASFVRSLQILVPEIRMEDLNDHGAGVRAQAIDSMGRLVQDFSIPESKDAIHVLNAPSPGATSALAISHYVVGLAEKSFGLRK